jgi:hypothetical protein
MGITLNDVKQSRFFKKEDLGVAGKMLVTIKDAKKENVAQAGQPAENKAVVYFVETAKPMVLNMANFQAIVAATGSDNSDGWIGKKVVVYLDPTIVFGGKVTGGLRIRAFIPKTVTQVVTPTPAPIPTTPVKIQTQVDELMAEANDVFGTGADAF